MTSMVILLDTSFTAELVKGFQSRHKRPRQRKVIQHDRSDHITCIVDRLLFSTEEVYSLC